jgi:hypothetical protein
VNQTVSPGTASFAKRRSPRSIRGYWLAIDGINGGAKDLGGRISIAADAFIGIINYTAKTLRIFDGVDYGFKNRVIMPEPGHWIVWHRAGSAVADHSRDTIISACVTSCQNGTMSFARMVLAFARAGDISLGRFEQSRNEPR